MPGERPLIAMLPEGVLEDAVVDRQVRGEQQSLHVVERQVDRLE